jgi:hypothetical protein
VPLVRVLSSIARLETSAADHIVRTKSTEIPTEFRLRSRTATSILSTSTSLELAKPESDPVAIIGGQRADQIQQREPWVEDECDCLQLLGCHDHAPWVCVVGDLDRQAWHLLGSCPKGMDR